MLRLLLQVSSSGLQSIMLSSGVSCVKSGLSWRAADVAAAADEQEFLKLSSSNTMLQLRTLMITAAAACKLTFPAG
jgi:hypothetical protein